MAKHERRAKNAASFKALWSQLGGRLLPEKIQKWLKAQRAASVRRRHDERVQAYHMLRALRKGHQIGNWYRRVWCRRAAGGQATLTLYFTSMTSFSIPA